MWEVVEFVLITDPEPVPPPAAELTASETTEGETN
jgi:hypothetical protein